MGLTALPGPGYGFILGEDRETYFIHCSNLRGGHIARGHQVDFKPFQNGRSDYNAREVIVIDAPEKNEEAKHSNRSNNKRGKHRSHNPCNADRLSRDDREFKRFVKGFFQEQNEMEEGGSAVYGQDGITERLSRTRRNH